MSMPTMCTRLIPCTECPLAVSCVQAVSGPAPSGTLVNPLTKALQDDAKEAYGVFLQGLRFMLRVMSTPNSKVRPPPPPAACCMLQWDQL